MTEPEVDHPEFGDKSEWEVILDHPFVGMDVRAEIDSRTVEGEIYAIWEYKDDPYRVDVLEEDGKVVNVEHGDDDLEIV